MREVPSNHPHRPVVDSTDHLDGISEEGKIGFYAAGGKCVFYGLEITELEPEPNYVLVG